MTQERKTVQIRKSISFSMKRDKELIAFLDELQEGDVSYEVKQLMKDGLKYRERTIEEYKQTSFAYSKEVENEGSALHEKKYEKPNKEKNERITSYVENSQKMEKNEETNWEQLMELETEEVKLDEEELDNRLDNL